MGSRRAGPGEVARPADLPEHRLRGLSLVPRHGARIVRGPGDRGIPQRSLRLRQGRPRGAAGPRPGLHGRGPGHDRRWRLADVGVPDAGRAALLRRDVLPERIAPRHAVLRPGARGCRPGMARAAWRGRRRRAAPGRCARRPEPRCRRRAGPDPRPARCGDGRDRGVVRRPQRRVGERPEVPAADDDRVPAPALRRDQRCPAAGDRPAIARCDGGRGRPRPARWRLPPLLDRRRVAGPALRADALRQRPTGARLRPRLGPDRRRPLPGGGRGDAGLHDPRADDVRRCVRRQPGRRYRGRGRRDVRVDRRRDRRGAGR